MLGKLTTQMPAPSKRYVSGHRSGARRRREPAKGSRAYWSARVTRESNSLDLERGVFNLTSPRRIARSLKRSADESQRRRAEPYQSAMSMLNFYINRAGKTCRPDERKS
jgi:hypothetical protein